MRRWILPSLAVSMLAFALGLWATGGLAAVGTQPGQAVRIMDGQHTQLATVDHTGRLLVDTGSTNTNHVTSATHVVGSVRILSGTANNQLAFVTHAGSLAVTCYTNAGVAESCAGAGSGDSVNVFHQSTVRHISSVTHMAAADGGFVIRDPINTGARARVDHTGALVTSATVTVTTDNVNVFHQSTVRHISSVTHMAAADGGFVIRDPINTGARARVDHTGALVTSATVTVTTDNVNVFHQSTVRHISSVTHIGGFIGIRDGLCATCWARVDHTGALVTSASVTTTVDNVNVFHQSTIRHVSSVTHFAAAEGGFVIRDPINTGARARVDHTGALVTSATVTVTTDNVNVFHESTIRHVSSLTHVVIVDWQRWAHIQASQSGAWTVQAAHLAGVPSVSQGSAWAVLAHAQQSGSWTVQAAHQGGEWNVRHIGSVLHVSIIQGGTTGANHLLVAPVYQAGAWNVSAAQSGTFTIQAAHQGGQWNVNHVGSVTHVVLVQSAHVNLAPSATFPVQQGFAGQQAWPVTAHQAGQSGNVWRIDHITSILHVSIIPGGSTGANHVQVGPVYQAGTWTVQPGNTPNTTAWLANIQHISSVIHVSLRQGTGTGADHLLVSATIVNSLAPRITVAHVTSVTHVSGLVSIRDDNCLTCRMRVDHYNVLVVQPHISGALRTWQVSQCGTTASTAINTNANRRDLWVMNRGNGNIYIGYGVTGHVALTTANGWPLHATASAITTVARHSTALSTVYLQNYQGPLACISDLAGQTLQVMEILR